MKANCIQCSHWRNFGFVVAVALGVCQQQQQPLAPTANSSHWRRPPTLAGRVPDRVRRKTSAYSTRNAPVVIFNCVPSCLLACLVDCLLACVRACLCTRLLAYVLACLLACILACLLMCLLTCLLACMHACLLRLCLRCDSHGNL